MKYIEYIVMVIGATLGIIGTIGEGRDKKGKLTRFGYITISLLVLSGILAVLIKINSDSRQVVNEMKQKEEYKHLLYNILRNMYPFEAKDVTLIAKYQLDEIAHSNVINTLEKRLPFAINNERCSSFAVSGGKVTEAKSIVGFVQNNDTITTFNMTPNSPIKQLSLVWEVTSLSTNTEFDVLIGKSAMEPIKVALISESSAKDFTNNFSMNNPSIQLLLEQSFALPARFQAEYNIENREIVLTKTISVFASYGDGNILSMFDVEGKCFALDHSVFSYDNDILPRPTIFIKLRPHISTFDILDENALESRL